MAGGHRVMATPIGDEAIAYALPDPPSVTR